MMTIDTRLQRIVAAQPYAPKEGGTSALPHASTPHPGLSSFEEERETVLDSLTQGGACFRIA
jgi:hypothetical protein